MVIKKVETKEIMKKIGFKYPLPALPVNETNE
jgi:hypothetical protein